VDIIRLDPSRLARRRSTRERSEARRHAFAAYFARARGVGFPRGRVLIQNPDERELQSRLCGVADAKGRCVGLAVIQRSSSRRLTLLTPVPKKEVAILQLGDLWLDRDWRDRV
jgi:polynucleotide 5'-kinase involved in rRNA processing